MGMPVIVSGSITKEVAVGDIIESVAMVQSAIAHILNAESEKMALAISNANVTLEELLIVNQSVKGTIAAVTNLEMFLKSKLEIYKDIICE